MRYARAEKLALALSVGALALTGWFAIVFWWVCGLHGGCP
jgi:hypothetical protein